MSTETAMRGFRFGERRRSGLFGTIPPTLIAIGAVTLVSAWLAVSGFIPIPLALLVGLVCAWFWFGKMYNRPAHEILPALVSLTWRKMRSRNLWYRPVELVTEGDQPIALPPVLSGLDLFEFEVAWITPGQTVPIGVVRDRDSGYLTAVMRVSGDGQFALVDPAGQDLRIDEWGAAISGFARENSPVVRVTFHDWTAPVPIRDTVAQLEERWADEPESAARADYMDLLRSTSAHVVDHEVLVEVTVNTRNVSKARGEALLTAALRTIGEQSRLFAGRLGGAGLRVEKVLSAADLVTAMRVRADPSVVEQLAALRRSLAAATGVAAPAFGPMLVDDGHVDHVIIDGAFHRSWWFASWPRREVTAAWMDALMFESDCNRSLTTVFEPVAPSKSDTDVDRERTQREANIESRKRKGYNVRRVDQKAVSEVAGREEELSAGFVECRFTGLVTLTAASLEELETQGADLEQTAANSGVELQQLLGQQAKGWVSSLPLGRSLARPFGES